MREKLMAILEAGRLCDVCRFKVTCYKEDWPHGKEYPPCATKMPQDWVDSNLVDSVYNSIIDGGI